MKSKAKPAKGSARTKRFDVGGTVGALAGLGTLAYLMSRKKKGDAQGTSSDTGVEAGIKAGEDQNRLNEGRGKGWLPSPEYEEAVAKDRMNEAVETHRKITSGGSNEPEPEPAPAPKPKPVVKKVVKKVVSKNVVPKKDDDKKVSTDKAPVHTGTGMAGSDRGAPPVPTLKGGESKVVGEGELKPYPANLPAVKEAERRKLLQRRVTTAGDPNKKEPTSAGFKRIQSAVQGTLDNAGKSTVRSDKEKMGERAREVERRRQEEKARKAGYGIKNGGAVKKYASGGSVSSASKRADGIAMRGKTRGKIC